MKSENRKHGMKGGRKTDTELYVQLAIIGILIVVAVFVVGKIYNSGGTGLSGGAAVSVSELIPTGVPAIYGKELGVNFDEVSPTNPRGANANIAILKNLDLSITLTGSDLQRFINIGSKIACEYCCGAKALVFSDGRAACGCAHSYAMRGLAKYLIKEHGKEYTNDAILSELGKWKFLFFPGISEQKAAVLKSKGIEINYINLESNKYRGIEKGQASGGGMVGGC